MTNFAQLLSVASDAVDLAVAVARSVKPGVPAVKGDRDLVSEVDIAVERQVREFLQSRTPEIGFLGEEEGRVGNDGRLMWALDPIDGTINFLHGLPLYAVSLGLVADETSVLGIIHMPSLGTRYTASLGRGAHVDGDPIRPSSTTSLADAVVAIGDYAVGDDAARKNRLRFEVTKLLASKAQRVRMHGSAAIDLAWLAEGRLDAVIIGSNKPWDVAAGVAIAREAGAQVLDLDGSQHSVNSGGTVAATSALIDQVATLVKQAGDHSID